MPTLKQENVKQLLTSGFRGSKADLLREAGYSASTVDRPNQVFRSQEVQEFIAEFETAGITNEVMVKKIAAAVNGKNADKALEQIWKIINLKYPAQRGPEKLADNLQVNVVMNPETIEESVMLWISNNPDKHSKVRELLS